MNLYNLIQDEGDLKMEQENQKKIEKITLRPDELPIENNYLSEDEGVKKYILKDNKKHSGIHLNIRESY